MTEKRYAAWADGVCKTCGNYTHSCECEHPQSPLLDKLFGTAPPTPADAGTLRVERALEARQNASDEARKVIEDGFPERGHIILEALTLLDSCVISLERDLQRAREEIERVKKRLAVYDTHGFKGADALAVAFISERQRTESAEQQLRAERERAEGLERVVVKAQGILGSYLPPDGISQDACINELLGLLDGPESREAIRRKEQK